jgi:hypothetical protein
MNGVCTVKTIGFVQFDFWGLHRISNFVYFDRI